MKYCLFLITIVLNLSLLAQQHFTPVDRDKVKKAVNDDKAPTAYKELLRRFNAFDSTLTLEDYRLLYYGFVFQKSFGDRFKHLVEAILSSGDGLTCETGFRVNTVPDEYTILYNYFNIEECKGQALVSHCDRMSVKPSDSWSKELLYFDATEILKKEEELFSH